MSLELVGGVGAALGIGDIAVRLIKTTAELYQAFRDAPEEFQSLRGRLGVLEDLVTQAEATKAHVSISAGDGESLRRAMHEVERCVEAIGVEYRKIAGTTKTLGRLRWVLIDREAVGKLEKRLETSQQLLVALIVMKQLPLQYNANSQIALVLRKVERMEVQLLSPTNSPRATPQSPRDDPRSKHHMFSSPLRKRKSQPSQTAVFQLPSWLTLLGLQKSILHIQRPHAKTVKVSARVQFPARRGRQRIAFLVDLTFHFASRFFFAYPSFGMCNVVPSDSIIMKACQTGDVRKVKELFSRNLASPRDVNPDNLSLLSLAVNRGHTELVALLLEQGADVNNPYGKNQTSPLQWALYQRNLDITRLLVEYGAEGDYVSGLGWTPAFYLFLKRPSMSRGPSSTCNSRDFFSIFSNGLIFLDLEVSNPRGDTVLRSTVSFGSGEDISGLLALGASPSRTGDRPWRNEWSLMHIAIDADNVSAIKVLLDLECFSNIDDEDYLGWTMLQHAMRLGHIEIVELLLERGCEEIVPDFDPEVGSSDYEWSLGGENKEFTPGHYAQSEEDPDVQDADPIQLYLSRCQWTSDKYFAYMKALLDHRRIELRTLYENGVVKDEIYWDANEVAGKFD
ncbi:hypothetical protein AK830_g5804 [Neonectria ditissima]|uniref:Uncharacterized protein n=1 Tax=Neonectria ditissima TaxID=78410 RepID=A0A0P7B3W4_9HYPO|nr:hypothetical protein AK830_g5804 [Neonectria ditissima]